MSKTIQPVPHHTASVAQTAEMLFRKGLHYAMDRNHDQAIAEFNRALELIPTHFAAINNLASCYTMTARTALALKTYTAALKLYPQSWEVLGGIANCYCQSGDFDEAAKYYKKALKADPDNILLIYNLGLVYKYNPNSPTMQRLLQLYEAGIYKDEARVSAGFTLAKMYENHGEHQRAFRYYDEANRLQFNLSGYKKKEEGFLAIFDQIEASFDAGYFDKYKNAGVSDATPVFVLGMPRSGTSLVEQILASHPAVDGAGEVDVLHSLVLKAAGLPDHYFLRPVPTMEHARLDQVAQTYLLRLRDYCQSGKLHIVDKTPMNFLLIGLIQTMFPRVTIIHCLRDPMDTCWSMFRQHFAGNHPYCYDQAALGTVYRRYRKLMQHWHRVLPGKIHDVRYEQLLAQPEPTIRALLDHCHLPWDEKCLSFHQTKRTINTASMSQVRQPLYKHSLRSWQPVAQELTPLQTALGLVN